VLLPTTGSPRGPGGWVLMPTLRPQRYERFAHPSIGGGPSGYASHSAKNVRTA
jgi:hypothetical protein